MATNTSAHHSLADLQGHTGSNYSIQSQQSSRNSNATQGTTASTLFAPPLPSNFSTFSSNASTVGNASFTSSFAQNGHSGGEVTATNNIMNSVADASSSLYPACVSLRQRLNVVPGFKEALLAQEEEADEDADPVTLLWRTFRKGFPLLLLYNMLRPDQPLTVPGAENMKEEKRGKAATFKFLQNCVAELKFRSEDCFIVTDLYGDDTTGFVKVARVVNRVLDVLVQRGLIEDIQPTASDYEQAAKGIKRSQRQHIIHELVTTERTYVQHLELLQAFKHLVEEKGIIAGDAVHDIFLNLNALLDFQRRFLIRVEQTNSLPEEDQNWGKLFLLYCEAFKVYEPYIANQRKCEKTVVAEFPRLREAGGSLEMRQMVESPTALYGFLMKPFQRISKYPLLLDDLYKKGDLDEARKQDLIDGKEAATSVLSATNKAIDREEKAEAVLELKMRVEDWKGHRVDHFGELLLYGMFTVLKNESASSAKDGERQYHVYLFETILLCCKDIDLSKPKNKLSNKQLTDKRGKPKLQLKGRIFMQNVTDLVSLAKPGMETTCLALRTSDWIFWKGDPSIENFVIRFTTEEAMRKWAMQIDAQRRKYRERPRQSDGNRQPGASATEFSYLQNQPAMENPYAQNAEDEEDDEVDALSPQPLTQGGDYARSRNGSSSSLRSRSTTAESSISMSGRAPPRLHSASMQQPALTVRTRELHGSPNEAGPDSNFSPSADSPITSSRTSSSSGLYPFPRQQMANGYYEEGHGHTRFTAPAIARRDPTPGAYPGPGRGASRPGYPQGTGMHSAQGAQMPLRNRSASSPDIHNGQRQPNGPIRNTPGQSGIPDLPTQYHHYPPHIVPRSQTNSPNLQNGAPPRGITQSPQQMQRDRAYQRQQSIDQGYGHGIPPGTGTGPGPRTVTPITTRNTAGPAPAPAVTSPVPSQSSSTAETPSQLKVKMHCPTANVTLTLVVPLNISYESLKDRIDAKLQRSTSLTLSDKGPKEHQVKLKYVDEEDYVSIQSDEDVQTAFETWREQRGAGLASMGELDLYCQR